MAAGMALVKDFWEANLESCGFLCHGKPEALPSRIPKPELGNETFAKLRARMLPHTTRGACRYEESQLVKSKLTKQ